MGHLSIVNEETLENVIKSGCISTRGDLGKMWVKTVADLFSDVLVTRPGHAVFPWCIGGPGTENVGFRQVFRVSGSPFYVPGDKYPIKVPLENKGLRYDNPVSEADALDLWGGRLLWNAIGKKSLGRGRSLTHQLPMEDERLLEMLDAVNSTGGKQVALGMCAKRGVPVTIDPSQDKADPQFLNRMEKATEQERISSLDIKEIPWRSGDRFKVEKALEAWIVENIDKSPGGGSFRESVLEAGYGVGWFGNYLPFGVAGSSIDVVVVQDTESGKVITAVELKVQSLCDTGFRNAVEQVREYTNFLQRAFGAYGMKVKTRKIIVAAQGSRTSRTSLQAGAVWKDTRLVTYSIESDGQVVFR
jgi:hypothetical protein